MFCLKHKTLNSCVEYYYTILSGGGGGGGGEGEEILFARKLTHLDHIFSKILTLFTNVIKQKVIPY